MPERGDRGFGMRPVPDKWWQYIPERPWPLWLHLMGFVIFVVSGYFFFGLGGVTGFLAGLAVCFLYVPVFVAWQWVRWKARRGPRAGARIR